MSSKRFDPVTRRAAAMEVLSGARAADVSEKYGTTLTTVWNWVHALERENEEIEREAEAREKAVARIVSRNAGKLALAEIETDDGLVLAVVNIGRNGAETGTVQRLAGARVGTGERIRGKVTRMWFVDPLLMRSVVEAHVANSHQAGT